MLKAADHIPAVKLGEHQIQSNLGSIDGVSQTITDA